jgi:hypothetical protein
LLNYKGVKQNQFTRNTRKETGKMKAYNLQAKTIKVGENDRTVLVLGQDGRGRVQKLIRCDLGLQDGETVTLKQPKPGMPGVPSIIKGGSDDNKWLMRISTDGAYIRGANGNVRYACGEVELIAKGYGAFGDAGRTGTWDDVLIVASVGTVIRVKPTRADAYYLYAGENSIQSLSAEEAEFEGLVIDKDLFTQI